MSFLAWRDYLETGIPLIDEQHRGLVELVNRVAPALAQEGAAIGGDSNPVLAELLAYAARHFSDEEAVMARTGLDPRAFDHHRETHRRFAESIARLVGQVEAGAPAGGENLLAMLSSWLLLHILGEDQAMARQVKAIEAGRSPAEAWVETRGGDIAPAPAVLSRALVDVYVVLTRQNREILEANRELAAQREFVARHNERLEATVRERTESLERLAVDLARARDAAQAADRAKGRFLSVAGHELRTPLNAVCGHAHVLARAGLDPALAAAAAGIEQAGARLAQLVDRLVAFAADDAPGASRPFAPARLVEDCAGRARAALAGRDVAVEVCVDPTVPPVLAGDETALRGALEPLVDNAAKFTSRGIVRLAATRLAAEAGRVTVRFEVADTGIGIAGPDLERLFVAFGQADERLARRFEGLGLGLALARKLAHRLGGTLAAESAPGAGSRFRIEATFDTADEAGEGRPPPEAAPGPAAPPAPATAGDPEAARDWLLAIAPLLETFDVAALQRVRDMPPAVAASLGEEGTRLRRSALAFEFDAAARLARARLARLPTESVPP